MNLYLDGIHTPDVPNTDVTLVIDRNNVWGRGYKFALHNKRAVAFQFADKGPCNGDFRTPYVDVCVEAVGKQIRTRLGGVQ